MSIGSERSMAGLQLSGAHLKLHEVIGEVQLRGIGAEEAKTQRLFLKTRSDHIELRLVLNAIEIEFRLDARLECQVGEGSPLGSIGCREKTGAHLRFNPQRQRRQEPISFWGGR